MIKRFAPALVAGFLLTACTADQQLGNGQLDVRKDVARIGAGIASGLLVDVLAAQGELTEQQRQLSHIGIGAAVDALTRMSAEEQAAALAELDADLRRALLLEADLRRKELGVPLDGVAPAEPLE